MSRCEAWRQEIDDAERTPLDRAIRARPMQLDVVVTTTLARQAFASQEDAVQTIAHRIRRAIDRPLNASEITKLEIATASAWNAASARKQSPWVCSDGSYHASDVDATEHQRTLDARREAMRARLARAAERLATLERQEDAADD